jgi:DinB family
MSSPTIGEIAFGDLERELAVTRKVLEKLPPEHYRWKPHEKSMSLGQLALHVAELPEWARGAIAQDVLDVAAAPRPPSELKDRQMLLERFDRMPRRCGRPSRHSMPASLIQTGR